MKKKYILVLLAAVFTVCYAQAQQQTKRQSKRQIQQIQQSQQKNAASQATFHGSFIENFSKPSSEFFNFNFRRSGYDYRYYSGMPSLTEKSADIMMYRLDPNDPAGAGRGPEIISKEFTHFGTYAARIRVPDVTKVQPNLGAVVGYFTYQVDGVEGQSEIDWEWLIADPEIIYIGTWTGLRPQHNRVGRTINLAKGIIYNTSYKSESREGADRQSTNKGQLTGVSNQPETIMPLKNYNASARFYTYGFDWYPDRLTWWIINPDTNEKIVLWDYTNPTTIFPGQPATIGVPVNPTHYRLNYWHTNNWPVQTNPNSIEPPRYSYELEIDWMSYTPFVDLNNAYQERIKNKVNN